MRHHYIPQWLLRNMQDSSGKIYGFRKAVPVQGIFTTTPKISWLRDISTRYVVNPDQPDKMRRKSIRDAKL